MTSAASAARHLAGKQHWRRPREQADAHANAERKQGHAQDHRAPQHLRKDTKICFFLASEGRTRTREREGGKMHKSAILQNGSPGWFLGTNHEYSSLK